MLGGAQQTSMARQARPRFDQKRGHDTAQLGCDTAERPCDTASPRVKVSGALEGLAARGVCCDTINCIMTRGRLGRWVVLIHATVGVMNQ